MTREAVVLLSGGLDSATTLAVARAEGFRCRTLTFDYGQRHRVEVEAAARVARSLGSHEHVVVRLDLGAIGGSALTAPLPVPKDRDLAAARDVPVTYVPARNAIFLSVGAALAESRGARDLFVGANAVDYSGYPDCRPEFLSAMEEALALGTRCGAAGDRVRVRAPLVALTKAEIVRRGAALGVDLGLTTSCYDPDAAGRACGRCDACVLRRRGFDESGVPDPTRYAP